MRSDSPFLAMTNFPLSDYSDLIPRDPTGSGADRYTRIIDSLSRQGGRFSVNRAFEMLADARQDGPDWTTKLSLASDAQNHDLFYCMDRHFDSIVKYDFNSPKTAVKNH